MWEWNFASRHIDFDVFKDFELKIKLEEGGIMPTRATKGDAGMDVYSPEDYLVGAWNDILIPLNWRCEFPDGYVMVFKEKSGVSTKTKMDIGACVVDSGYRGIVHAHLINNTPVMIRINKGQKVAQFTIYPC